jgi:glycosyltransferase involved in cell wall biosynthesis
MRIGIDARLTYYRRAGISQYTVQLIEALSRLDLHDDFVVIEGWRAREPIIQHDRFETRHVCTPSHHRLEQIVFPLELAPMRLDLLHSPDFIPPFRARAHSVITVHDLVFLMFPHFLTKDSARYYGQIDHAVRRANAVIAVSHATKKDLVQLLGVPEDKIQVIYEAASPLFRPLPREDLAHRLRGRFGIQGDYLLFVSTIEPRKNVPFLLRAYRQLVDNYGVDARLVLAGEKGWLFDEVFDLTKRLNLEDRVLFLGRVSTKELLWLYNAAQALVAPSIYEGFGLTPLEAMACGTPVIVSNVSSLPEIVADAGLSVDPTDLDALTVAMWRILDDSDLRCTLSQKGLKRASLFSWDKAARETLALYQSLA